MNEKEISALISLIDDPDENIFNQVKKKLLEMGGDVIPALEQHWESNHLGLVFQHRVENLIHEIQFETVRLGLEEWVKDGGNDLLHGVLLVNRYQYPDLDEGKIKRRLHQLKQDVWLELNDNLTGFEKIRVINHVLFDVHNLNGNKKNYHAPQNSYLNNVLESGKGNPLTLSIIYILICEMVDVPVFGVNLPNHFILAYLDELGIISKLSGEENDGVLFYINPFSRGTIFNRKEIEQFLDQLKLEKKKEYFKPCDNISIVKRVITNLVYSYEKLGYKDKSEELKILYASIDSAGLAEGTI